jgi:large subunit ribosomal protein L32e
MTLVKKSHPKFNVPNFGAKSRSRVKERWRKQRGIDSKKRVKKDFAGAEPTIGYGNPKEIKHIRASGKRTIMVYNVAQLKGLLNGLDSHIYEITLSGSLSTRKKAEMTKIAGQSKVNVTNGVFA